MDINTKWDKISSLVRAGMLSDISITIVGKYLCNVEFKFVDETSLRFTDVSMRKGPRYITPDLYTVPDLSDEDFYKLWIYAQGVKHGETRVS